ncbi:PREDICTED: thioredoxin domain-containing protein-like [Acropora digitifera]|uniref:thioredoxin domain-containing protein-like n=1 Tax=Acropora digitifera TaxID=70779 RepID=UPI00077A6A07|nr:PREDICTED: thioredoxin domain-containing protein-like [Acropora digitifera]
MAERMSFCYICAYILLFESCFGDNSVKILNDESFEHLTQASTGATTGDWFIVFSFTDKDPECTECKKADEAIAKAQEKLSHKLNFALVLPPKSKLTLKRFDVARWPHVILLKQGKQYTYSEGKIDEESFIRFIEKGYELAASQPVPPPIGKFDIFIEGLMDDIKHMIQLRKNAAAVIFFAGVLFGLMLTPVLKLLAECLINSFTQEPDQDLDEGLGQDEVDEDEDQNEEEEKKER